MIGKTNVAGSAAPFYAIASDSEPTIKKEDVIWLRTAIRGSKLMLYNSAQSMMNNYKDGYITILPDSKYTTKASSGTATTISQLPTNTIRGIQPTIEFKYQNVCFTVVCTQAYMCIDGKPRKSASYIYRDGTWQRISFGGVLLHPQNAYVSFIFGNSNEKGSIGYRSSNVTLRYREIVFNSNSGAIVTAIAASKQYVTPYTKLCVDLSATLLTNGKFAIGVSNTNQIKAQEAFNPQKYVKFDLALCDYVYDGNTHGYHLELDIKDLVGEYYVAVAFRNCSGYVSRIYLD